MRLFTDFWGRPDDFLSLDALADLGPRRSNRTWRERGYRWEDRHAVIAALLRREPSPRFVADLAGLLHPSELLRAVALLARHESQRARSRPGRRGSPRPAPAETPMALLHEQMLPGPRRGTDTVGIEL
jgi:hypothetical protein